MNIDHRILQPGWGGDLAPVELIENAPGAAREQVGYRVDLAKAEALDLLGETRQAFELVDRHVQPIVSLFDVKSGLLTGSNGTFKLLAGSEKQNLPKAREKRKFRVRKG